MKSFQFVRLETTKEIHEPGETVYINYSVLCNSSLWEPPSGARIDVLNAETGKPIQLYGKDLVYIIPALSSGRYFKMDGATLGKVQTIPIWKVRFILTP